MLQKLPVNNFDWIKNTSQFNEGFIENYNEESDIFSKLMFNILNSYTTVTMICRFYRKE